MRTAFKIAAVAVAIWGFDDARLTAQEAAAELSRLVYRNTPRVAYVGSQACALCHSEIYATYQRTAMGRSMSPANDADHLKKVSEPVVVHDRDFDRHYTVFAREGALYQSQHEIDGTGQEVFRTTHKLEYAVGSGVNGHTYAVRRGDHLFEAPLSFYSRIGRWDLSPGYQREDIGFSRPIVTECVVCHSGRPQAAPLGEGRFRDPPFEELSIGCENCHGPGELHVKERGSGRAADGDVDTTIVNPAKLPPRLAEDICMKCHQDADVRLLQPGKDYLDFRPGLPLNETLALLKAPRRKGTRDDGDLLEHHTAMKLSRCYLESEGGLSCLTCHDNLHRPVPVATKAESYRDKCFTCHEDSNCSAPRESRIRSGGPDDCAGCHMPKRAVEIISHSSLTQHRIPRRPDHPYPTAAYQQTSAGLPDLVYVNGDPAAIKSLPCVTLLQAYAEVAKKNPEYISRYLAVLEECSQVYPDHPFVRAGLARKAMYEATPEALGRAADELAKAIELGINAEGPYHDLADVLTRLGRVEEGIQVLREGVKIFPYSANLRNSLAARYVAAGRYAEAKAVMQELLERFPGDRDARKKLQTFQREIQPR